MLDKMDRIVDLLKNPIIVEQDHGTAIFRIYENRIFHVTVRKGELVTMDLIKKGYQLLKEFGGGMFYNIYEFHSFSDVEPEVRQWMASPSNRFTMVDAIVIDSFPQKIVADFYVRYDKPERPTKIFNSMDRAVEWIHGHIENTSKKAS